MTNSVASDPSNAVASARTSAMSLSCLGGRCSDRGLFFYKKKKE
jgi:hypothetical protein